MSTLDPTSEWLPLAEAVTVLGKAERTIRLWIDAGRIEGRKIEEHGRAKWLVRVKDGEPVPPDPIPESAEGLLVREPLVPSADLERVHLELIRRHEAAVAQLAVARVELQRLPALEEGMAAREGRVVELEAAREAAAREVEAARMSEARERRRARVAVILAALLAVLCAALSGMLLQR